MSTPQLDTVHFASVAKSLIHYANIDRDGRSAGMLECEICRAAGIDVFGADHGTAEAALEALVFDWARSNALASGVRYRNRPEAVSPDFSGGRVLSPMGLYKALQCVEYNCDGGDGSGPGLAESLEVLGKLIDRIGKHILETSPEYGAAEWFL